MFISAGRKNTLADVCAGRQPDSSVCTCKRTKIAPTQNYISKIAGCDSEMHSGMWLKLSRLFSQWDICLTVNCLIEKQSPPKVFLSTLLLPNLQLLWPLSYIFWTRCKDWKLKTRITNTRYLNFYHPELKFQFRSDVGKRLYVCKPSHNTKHAADDRK